MALPPLFPMNESPSPWEQREIPARPRLRRILQTLSLPLLIFFTLPLLALFLRTPPSDLISNLSRPVALQAMKLSMITTVATTLISVLFGTPLAYALARRAIPYRRVIDTLIDLPTVLPPAVAGVALLMAFGRRGVLGNALEVLGIHIAFTTMAVILAQTFIAAPFYIKAAILGFTAIDRELEQAAGLDGANNWQIFRFVILPLSWSALVSGSVMTWARALGEFGATIIFAGNFPGRTQTMPLAIYIGFELDLQVALTLSVVLLVFAFIALVVVKSLLDEQES
jgi:molybdate transport system permease protein